MTYNVWKYNPKTDQFIIYGQMCYDDMKLVTRGYRQSELDEALYVRRNSRAYFVVEKMN